MWRLRFLFLIWYPSNTSLLFRNSTYTLTLASTSPTRVFKTEPFFSCFLPHTLISLVDPIHHLSQITFPFHNFHNLSNTHTHTPFTTPWYYNSTGHILSRLSVSIYVLSLLAIFTISCSHSLTTQQFLLFSVSRTHPSLHVSPERFLSSILKSPRHFTHFLTHSLVFLLSLTTQTLAGH